MAALMDRRLEDKEDDQTEDKSDGIFYWRIANDAAVGECARAGSGAERRLRYTDDVYLGAS